MSSQNRRPYLTATVLNQVLLDQCADNFETRIEMVVDIQKPNGTYIYASDRNKYVGGTFYEALLKFPVISRTVGEWLAPVLQFSTLNLEVSNADGRFNEFLPGGASYDSFIGRSVQVKIGLAEQASTYITIFDGKITEVGGFSRSTFSVTFIARDNYDKFSVTFPRTTLSRSIYPNLDDSVVGKILPVIYGDFTTSLDPSPAIVPAYVLNGADPLLVSPSHGLRPNVQLRVSDNDLSFFNTSGVYLYRSDVFYNCPAADVILGAGNKIFQIDQDTSHSWVDSKKYLYEKGDQFFVQVRGKDLGAYDDNIIAQAKDILLTYGGALSTDFASNWDTYRDKSSPSQSNIAGLKSRIWENEPKPVMEYVLSLLEQVRLEAFIDKNLKLKINSLHFEDWVANPSFDVKNWDIVEKTFKPKTDERNNFNRAQGTFDFHPNRNEQAQTTAIFKNDASFNQVGKFISKRIGFPNLYVRTDVENQLKEILKLSSSLFEIVDASLTWRALLLDVGDWLTLNVEIGSVLYDNVPALIRTKGYDPLGVQIPVQLWSMQLLPFPGYTPGYSGTVGGYNAIITQE